MATVLTLRYSLESKCATPIVPDHVLWPWLIRHSAWAESRFAIKSNKKTSYENAFSLAYRGEVCQFGEKVLFLEPSSTSGHMTGNRRRHKADKAWVHGVWVGKKLESDEHLVATSTGVHSCRTVRRLPKGSQFDAALIDTVVGNPWNTRVGAGRPKGRGVQQLPVVGGGVRPLATSQGCPTNSGPYACHLTEALSS